ncbi:hypothetical protein [Streptosporangium sp. NPDC049078]|uniref:hypothetical protein n=1 Tax=Streptosporangium sp. NPDC049078 TaxID=3155767 RepID=UPI0034124B37
MSRYVTASPPVLLGARNGLNEMYAITEILEYHVDVAMSEHLPTPAHMVALDLEHPIRSSPRSRR